MSPWLCGTRKSAIGNPKSLHFGHSFGILLGRDSCDGSFVAMGAQRAMGLSRLWPRILLCGAFAGLVFLTISCARESPAEQPVAFSHRVHAEKRLTCVFCHGGAEKHAQATMPSVVLCMTCHTLVKPDSAEIRKVKTYLEHREEIPWRRIYAFSGEAAVFFNHHRHAAAGIKCVACHGDAGSRDVLTREVRLTMGFCVECHRENSSKFRDKRLADDCVTCHR